jgi:hypothetical protein
MALHDLTPQLRTRLSRMERAVGWFVFLAVLLLLVGLGFYIRQAAINRGWGQIKAPFHTFVQSSAGLKVGDAIVMMGFNVGNITLVKPMPPGSSQNVRLEFEIRDPYFRYMDRQGSMVIINSAGFLNTRQLEITRGTNHSYELVVTQPVYDKTIDEAEKLATEETNQWQLAQDLFDQNSNVVCRAYKMLDATNVAPMAGLYTLVGNYGHTRLVRVSDLAPPSNTICIYDNTINRNHVAASWHEYLRRYVEFTPEQDSAWLSPVEPVGVADRLAQVVAQVQAALPNFFALTNQLNHVLVNAANLTSNLNTTVADVHPQMSATLTNLAAMTSLLREPGGMGVMALGTNGPPQLQTALANVNILLEHTDTNLDTLVFSVGQTLSHVADITSNLNAQVQADPNMLVGISKTITDTDTFIQGLKHHWLLRSAFKTKKTNDVPAHLVHESK